MARALFILSLILVVAVAPLPWRVRAALAALLALVAGGVFYLSIEQERAHQEAAAAAASAESERWVLADGSAGFERVSFGAPLFFSGYATVDMVGFVRAEGDLPTAVALRVVALECAAEGDCVERATATAEPDLVAGRPGEAARFDVRLRFSGLSRPAGSLRFEPALERLRY